LKRGYGLGLIVERSEQIQQTDHLQSLEREFGGLKEADRAASLLGGSEMANQHANAAGINGGDAFEVENYFGVTLAEEFVDGGVEAVERGTHGEAPSELDYFDAVESFRINVQRCHPLETPGSPNAGRLTLQYGFVRVRAQLS
jgi:hypothetical protein